MSDRSQSRRQYLSRVGTVTGTAAIGSFAGCTSLLGDSGGGIGTLSIAYKPVFPFLQHHVMDQRGHFDELEPSVESTNFADKGLTIVSAFADGDIDLAFMGITPVIKMKDKGVPGKVTAANHKNGFLTLAHEDFTPLWEEHGADAFEQFREQEGRKFRFSTFPKGSVAYIALDYWLREELGVSPDVVDIENMAGGGPVRRSLLSGNADGTLIMEPIPTVLQAKDAPFDTISWTGSFMSGQPGGVMFMHDRLWKENEDLAQSIVDRHVRATNLINDEPDTAARAVSKSLGEKVPLKIVKQSLQSKASNYISDPRKVTDDTEIFVSRMQSLGQIQEAVETDEIYEPSLYQNR